MNNQFITDVILFLWSWEIIGVGDDLSPVR